MLSAMGPFLHRYIIGRPCCNNYSLCDRKVKRVFKFCMMARIRDVCIIRRHWETVEDAFSEHRRGFRICNLYLELSTQSETYTQNKSKGFKPKNFVTNRASPEFTIKSKVFTRKVASSVSNRSPEILRNRKSYPFPRTRGTILYVLRRRNLGRADLCTPE